MSFILLNELYFVVPQLLEFDILMEYYNKLRGQMKLIDAYKLCDWFASAEIIAHDNVGSYAHAHAFMMYGPQEILLAKVANHLLGGETHVLYIMFETLQNHSDLFHNLVSEIQVTLDHKLHTGKYVRM